jgi:hypothetical protein
MAVSLATNANGFMNSNLRLGSATGTAIIVADSSNVGLNGLANPVYSLDLGGSMRVGTFAASAQTSVSYYPAATGVIYGRALVGTSGQNIANNGGNTSLDIVHNLGTTRYMILTSAESYCVLPYVQYGVIGSVSTTARICIYNASISTIPLPVPIAFKIVLY